MSVEGGSAREPSQRDAVPILTSSTQLAERTLTAASINAYSLTKTTRHTPEKFHLPPRYHTANQFHRDDSVEATIQKTSARAHGSLPSRIDLPSLGIGEHPSQEQVRTQCVTSQRNSPSSSWISASPGRTGPSWRRHVLNDNERTGKLDMATTGDVAQQAAVVDARLMCRDRHRAQGSAWSRHGSYPYGMYTAALPVVRKPPQPVAIPIKGYHQPPVVVPMAAPNYRREFVEPTARRMSQTPRTQGASMQYGIHKKIHHPGVRLTHNEATPHVIFHPSGSHHRTDISWPWRSHLVSGNVISQHQTGTLAPQVHSVINGETGERRIDVSYNRTPYIREKSTATFPSEARVLPTQPVELPPSTKRPPSHILQEPVFKKAKGFDKLDLLCSATLDIGELHDNPTGCSCPKSKCVALYCDCFKAGRRCDPINCSCEGCKNTIAESGVDGARTKAIRCILARNPRAFNTAGVGNPTLKLAPGEIACNCVRSRCLKLYCSCFHNGKTCMPGVCTCVGCQNTEADEDGHRKAAMQQAIEKRADAFVVKQKAKGLGCACKNNRCIRKYCECFRTGLGCTDKCSCRECENPNETR